MSIRHPLSVPPSNNVCHREEVYRFQESNACRPLLLLSAILLMRNAMILSMLWGSTSLLVRYIPRRSCTGPTQRPRPGDIASGIIYAGHTACSSMRHQVRCEQFGMQPCTTSNMRGRKCCAFLLGVLQECVCIGAVRVGSSSSFQWINGSKLSYVN